MRLKLTKKQVVDGSASVYSVGYQRLQKTLFTIQSVGYVSGTYGWNCDVYDLGGDQTLVTGYRTFGKVIPDEVIKECETLAENTTPLEAREHLKEWIREQF